MLLGSTLGSMSNDKYSQDNLALLFKDRRKLAESDQCDCGQNENPTGHLLLQEAQREVHYAPLWMPDGVACRICLVSGTAGKTKGA